MEGPEQLVLWEEWRQVLVVSVIGRRGRRWKGRLVPGGTVDGKGSGVGGAFGVGEVSENKSNCRDDVSRESAVGFVGEAGGAGGSTWELQSAGKEALVRERRGQAGAGLDVDAFWVRVGRGGAGAAIEGASA